ncbi:hypothetical protein CKAH01_12028 [Colletotrichum kahawae]|uniref:Uncharacterized protein n=1 Tax=Colletotrichum kahawae TaxID=34407 RepID=A0AAD9YSF8_COLKA|nr:hypothetical protein CKAH01_12028 [Colletotrichum kahawae]
MAAIARVADLSKAHLKLCDDLLGTLAQKNQSTNNISEMRKALWEKVFSEGWTPETDNPGPGLLRKRTSEETALYVGTLNEDVPVRSKGNMIPDYRRARQPVMLKASFQFGGKLAFVWVDSNYQKIPAESVDIDGDMSFEEVKGMVASHYDTNEVDRVGGYNWEKVTYWARHRIVTLAHRTNVGVGVIGRPKPLPDVQEDLDELQRVRLVEQYMREEEMGEEE